jgi:hypothetical protein
VFVLVEEPYRVVGLALALDGGDKASCDWICGKRQLSRIYCGFQTGE